MRNNLPLLNGGIIPALRRIIIARLGLSFSRWLTAMSLPMALHASSFPGRLQENVSGCGCVDSQILLVAIKYF